MRFYETINYHRPASVPACKSSKYRYSVILILSTCNKNKKSAYFKIQPNVTNKKKMPVDECVSLCAGVNMTSFVSCRLS